VNHLDTSLNWEGEITLAGQISAGGGDTLWQNVFLYERQILAKKEKKSLLKGQTSTEPIESGFGPMWPRLEGLLDPLIDIFSKICPPLLKFVLPKLFPHSIKLHLKNKTVLDLK
jgi:hypothetical protein